MNSPIVGYIVVGRDGEPLEFCTHPEYPHKILLRADVASVFASRTEAEAAIEATQEWAETHREAFGGDWVDGQRLGSYTKRLRGGAGQGYYLVQCECGRVNHFSAFSWGGHRYLRCKRCGCYIRRNLECFRKERNNANLGKVRTG